MRTHVQIVAALIGLIGAAFILGALVAFGLFGGLAAIAGASGEEGAAFGAWILGLAGTALGGLMLVLAVPTVLCSVGLWRLRPWGRILAIVIAACSLVNVPWGTAFGVYALWVLFSERTKPLFGGSGA